MKEVGYCKPTDKGVELRLHVQPNASRTEPAGLHGDRLKIRVKGKPAEGEANKEICATLAKWVGLAKSSVEIRRGASSRQKDLWIGPVSDRKEAESLVAIVLKRWKLN